MKLMKVVKTGLVLLFLGVFFSSVLIGAEMKPIAAVSVSAYDQIDSSIAKILDTAGYKEIYSAVNMLIGGIDGLDKTKPAGFVLLSNGKDIVPFGFMPVADFDELTCPGIEVLKEKFQYDPKNKTIDLSCGEGDEDDSTGLKEEALVRLVENNDWLFLVPVKQENLVPTDTDPVQFLEGLDGKYMAGGFVYIDQIPEELVDSAFAPLRVEAAKDEDIAKSLESLGKGIEYLKSAVQKVEFGFSVDQTKGDVVGVTEMIPVSGSSLAESSKETADAKTLWNDFFQPENAVFACQQSQVFDKALAAFQKENWISSFESAISSIEKEGGEETEEVRNLLSDLQAWIVKSCDSGQNDFAMSLMSDTTLVIGGTISDGVGLQTLIQKAFTSAKKELEKEGDIDDPDVKKFVSSFKINNGKYEGYSVSTCVIPEDWFGAAFPGAATGSGYSILVGVSEDAMILIAGPAKKNVSNLFKEKASMKREKASASQEWRLSASNLGGFASNLAVTESDETVKKIVDAVKAGSKDAVITSKAEYSESAVRQTTIIKGEFIKLIGDAVGAVVHDEEDETDGNDGKYGNIDVDDIF